jgi:hypothetical protein
VSATQLVHDAQPELPALVLLEPEGDNRLGAVGAHAERDAHRLGADDPLVADLDPQSASKKTRGQAGSSGRACQAAISSRTASVTAPTRSGETSMPWSPRS